MITPAQSVFRGSIVGAAIFIGSYQSGEAQTGNEKGGRSCAAGYPCVYLDWAQWTLRTIKPREMWKFVEADFGLFSNANSQRAMDSSAYISQFLLVARYVLRRVSLV